MSDEQRPWDQIDGEPILWYKRFTRYRLLWPVRSIAAAYKSEQEENEEKRGKTRATPRTEADGTWYEMARAWKWEERAAAWDAQVDAELEKTIAAERKKILRTGMALQHKRIERLNYLVEKLLLMVEDEDKVWVPDVKSVGTGPTAERVDLVQFNAPLFHEIRAHLADIAAEMGERSKKSEVALTVLPKVYQGTDPDEDGTEE